ncbi:MAG: hypothetical protein ABI632_09560 [Pseudolysinimonas sp.]
MTDPIPSDAPVVPAADVVPAAPAADVVPAAPAPDVVPAAPAADVVPAAPAADVVPVAAEMAPRKSHGLGIFALLLGLLAFFADIALIVFAIVQVAAIANNFDISTFNPQTILLGLAGYAAIALIAFFVGFGVAVLAILLGIIAAVKNRGRAAGIFGAIFGLLVLASHLIVLGTIAGSGSLISQIPGLGN